MTYPKTWLKACAALGLQRLETPFLGQPVWKGSRDERELTVQLLRTEGELDTLVSVQLLPPIHCGLWISTTPLHESLRAALPKVDIESFPSIWHTHAVEAERARKLLGGKLPERLRGARLRGREVLLQDDRFQLAFPAMLAAKELSQAVDETVQLARWIEKRTLKLGPPEWEKRCRESWQAIAAEQGLELDPVELRMSGPWRSAPNYRHMSQAQVEIQVSTESLACSRKTTVVMPLPIPLGGQLSFSPVIDSVLMGLLGQGVVCSAGAKLDARFSIMARDSSFASAMLSESVRQLLLDLPQSIGSGCVGPDAVELSCEGAVDESVVIGEMVAALAKLVDACAKQAPEAEAAGPLGPSTAPPAPRRRSWGLIGLALLGLLVLLFPRVLSCLRGPVAGDACKTNRDCLGVGFCLKPQSQPPLEGYCSLLCENGADCPRHWSCREAEPQQVGQLAAGSSSSGRKIDVCRR